MPLSSTSTILFGVLVGALACATERGPKTEQEPVTDPLAAKVTA